MHSSPLLRFVRRVLVLASCLLATEALLAQTPGAISGVVTDAQGNFVIGAQVTVEGSSISSSTDRMGNYRLTGVPAGTQRVVANYLGMDPVNSTVEVASDQTATANIAFQPSETVTMQAFEVASVREGQARATNLQRTADQIKNIIATDAMGRLPDASAGEALSRIVGVGIQSDRGEAEFISVRGLSPKYNAVAINGERGASASDPTESRQSRTLSLDSVPTDLIASIEVTKTSTADMDADSLGANVNMITKSPLDFSRRVITGKIEYGLNQLDDVYRRTYSGGFTYGDRFLGNKLGILLSGSYQENHRDVNGRAETYVNQAVAGVATTDLPTEVGYLYRWLERERKAINAQVYYRVSDSFRTYVRALYNDFADRDQVWNTRMRYDSGASYLAGSNKVTGSVDGGRITRADRESEKATEVWNIGTGGDWSSAKYQLDYALSFGRSAYEVNRIQPTWEYRLSDYSNANGVRLNVDGVADFTYNFSDPMFPRFTDSVDALRAFNRFEIGTRSSVQRRTDENHEFATTASINLKIASTFFSNPGSWKVGLKFRNIDKYSNPWNATFNVPAAQRLTLDRFLDQGRVMPIWDGRYVIGPSTNVPQFWRFFNDNPGNFTFSQAAFDQTNLPTRYRVNEDVPAGYVMATTDIGRLRLVGGLRYELTRGETESYRLNFDSAGVYTGATKVRSSYSDGDFFPSAVATYKFTDRIQARAGITRAISRPDYDQILASEVVNDNNDTVTRGNPNLKPLFSTNYDLSFEWYSKGGDMFSVGTFYKDIQNSIYSVVSIPTTGQYAGYQVTQPLNSKQSSLLGFEVAISKNFRSLPAPFNGLGFQANYTKLYGKTQLPSRSNIKHLIDQPEATGNIQISYELHPISLRVAYTYNDDYIRLFDANSPTLDAWVKDLKTIDASIDYKLKSGWTLYVQGKNLGNEITKYFYQGENRTDRPTELEFVGCTVLAGLKFEF